VTAISCLPGVVIRSLPAKFDMYPRPINRALCSAGITAGGSFTDVSPTLSREANSSPVSGFDDLWTIILYAPFRFRDVVNFAQFGRVRPPGEFFFAQRKETAPARGSKLGPSIGERAVIGDRDTLDNPLAQNPFQPYFRLNRCTACADKKLPEDCAVRTRYNAASIIQLGGVVHFSGLF
jgi:hypothetical protein